MPFQSAPQCAELVIIGTSGAKPIYNVLNFTFGATYSGADITNLANACSTVVMAQYPALVNGNVTLYGVRAKGLENVNDFQYQTSPTPDPGNVGTKPLPANTTLCITLRSGLTGRSARGRFYAFPTGDANLSTSPDLFESAYADDLVDMLDDITTVAAAQGWAMCVLSRRAALAVRPTAVPFIVTNIQARNLTADSQRGRLPNDH